MLELQRTNDDFTSGIVNVPQNTPAYLLFICKNELEAKSARLELSTRKIDFDYKERRGFFVFTSNHIVHSDTINTLKAKYPQIEVKRKTIHRYVFFELDELDQERIQFVLSIYAKYNLPVFYHRTMRGVHFLSIKPIAEELYHEIMPIIKPLNTACPHITLRIKPNKWIGEREIFSDGRIQMQALHSDTIKLQKSFQELCSEIPSRVNFELARLKQKYLIVNYRQTGEMANL